MHTVDMASSSPISLLLLQERLPASMIDNCYFQMVCCSVKSDVAHHESDWNFILSNAGEKKKSLTCKRISSFGCQIGRDVDGLETMQPAWMARQ